MLLLFPVFGCDGVVTPPDGGRLGVGGLEGREGVGNGSGPSSGRLGSKEGVWEPAGPSPGVAGILSTSKTGMVLLACFVVEGAVYL